MVRWSPRYIPFWCFTANASEENYSLCYRAETWTGIAALRDHEMRGGFWVWARLNLCLNERFLELRNWVRESWLCRGVGHKEQWRTDLQIASPLLSDDGLLGCYSILLNICSPQFSAVFPDLQFLNETRKAENLIALGSQPGATRHADSPVDRVSQKIA
jgi:hypothetical protein